MHFSSESEDMEVTVEPDSMWESYDGSTEPEPDTGSDTVPESPVDSASEGGAKEDTPLLKQVKINFPY